MSRLIALLVAGVVLTGCGTMTPKDMIKTANMAKNLAMISKAGVSEELSNCAKDIFDPHNRGSGC